MFLIVKANPSGGKKTTSAKTARTARPTSEQRRGRESMSGYYRRTGKSALGAKAGQPLQNIKRGR